MNYCFVTLIAPPILIVLLPEPGIDPHCFVTLLPIGTLSISQLTVLACYIWLIIVQVIALVGYYEEQAQN